MAYFGFGRKLEAAKEYSLEEIPVFSSLSPFEQKLIEKKARLVQFKRGDIIYKESTPAEAFYVVISGRLRLFTQGRGNLAEETLVYFHRGDHFGETSLLTGRPHSATIEAKRDGLLLKLDKEDFFSLIKDIPSISLHLSRSLGHRLTKNIDVGGRREVKISGLYARSQHPEIMQFWLDFAGSLKTISQRPVVLVDFSVSPRPVVRDAFKQRTLPSFDLKKMEPSREADLKTALIEHSKGFSYLHALAGEEKFDSDQERKVATLITFLTYRYNYLLLRLPHQIGPIAFKVLKQSDYIYHYGGVSPSELDESAEVIAELQKNFGFSKSEIRMLIPHEATGQGISYEEKEEILGTKIFSVIPPQTEQPGRYQNVLRYLSKELAGTLTGLVLGSGAAFGLAHIGVLRVLEEEGIDIDVIAGSSIGALIGALWAAGYDSKELEKLAKSIDSKRTGFFKLIGFKDISIAHRGFFKGNQVTKFIRSLIGDKTFQDLKIPVKILAADLFTSQPVIFETGKVVDAIRASISIPGIFRPVSWNGRFLIDGGVIDPLPVKVLANMGVKKIIAVNVLAGPKDRIERNHLATENRRRSLEALKRRNVWGKIMARSSDQVYSRYAVNIFNVIMSTVQFMEYEIANSWAEQADILIHPIVPDGHWAEFYSPDKFIQIGERKTREQIDEIKHLVAENSDGG